MALARYSRRQAAFDSVLFESYRSNRVREFPCFIFANRVNVDLAPGILHRLSKRLLFESLNF